VPTFKVQSWTRVVGYDANPSPTERIPGKVEFIKIDPNDAHSVAPGLLAAFEYTKKYGIPDRHWFNVGSSPKVVIRTEELPDHGAGICGPGSCQC